jgi:hypothetical protein
VRIEHSDTERPDRLPAYGDVLIVGVAQDVVSGFVYDGLDRAHLYLPTNPAGPHAGALLVRGRATADFRQRVLPELLQRVHADPYAFEALPLTEVLALQMFPLRVASWIGALLGAIAMALSVSGLYGVLTFMLSQRTKEIGIRVALGATSARVMRLVMRQCARLAAYGMAIGVGLGFAVMTVLSSLIRMRNVSVVDAGAFGAAVLLVSVAAALAAYLPARRAARLDPMTALRHD